MIRSIGLAMVVAAFATGGAAQAPPAPASQPALPTVSTVGANGAILLIPGRQLTLTWTPGAPPTLASESAAPARSITPPISHPTDEAWVAKPANGQVRPAEPGQVSFTLSVDDKVGTMLIAASGQPQPIFYMANLIMRREGRLVVSPTTTCSITPARVGIESWPYRVEAIQIVGMGLSAEGMCYDNRAKKGYKMGEQPPSAAQP